LLPPASFLTFDYPASGGLDFQAELAKADTHLPIIFISGHGDIPMTVRAMKAGAIEFLTKPFRDQDLLDAVQLAFQRDRDSRVRESAVSQTRARFEALNAPRTRGAQLGHHRSDEQASCG
jgi:FixJ family two-component response regulator